MNIQIVETLGEFKARLGLTADGILIEEDLDLIETDCDLNERKRRDAEVLCTLAANVRGPCLDLGTSHGRSAFKLATNLRERGTVFTVNILPEQHDKQSGELVTHLLSNGEIGSFFRSRGVTGIEQIYADTAKWQMPPELRDFSLAFVDAAHDTENVLADSRKIFPRVHDGGYIVWHDFNPLLRGKFHWIDASMRGVERFFAELGVEPEIIWLRNSWMAVWRKPVVAVKAVKNSNAPVELIEAVSSRAVSPPEQFKPVRFAWMFPAYSRERVEEEAGWASRISALGYNVEIFGVPCPDGWWPFPKLDAAWKRRDPALMRAYDQVASRLHRGDVLVASGGSMIHPEFVRQLPALSVFTCGDDPESSEVLSHPAAPAFDVSLVGNVACLDLYRSWGCRHVDWLYQAIRPEFLDPTVTEESILAGGRDMDAVMFCERIYGFSDRAQRIERLVREFPQATVRGKGWPGGFVTHAEMLMLMRRARLGWNLHNSIGPCNMRLVTLPALGAMQICDNKQHLGKLFKLDEEIVGFDTIEECVEKTRHYLTHEDERRAIAARGWKRAVTDYTEPKQWEQLLAKIHPAWCEKFSADREANGSSAVEIRSHNSHREAAGVELNPHPAARANETVHPLFPDARVGVAVANNGKNYEPARVRELIHEAIALYTGDRLGFGAFINAGDRVLIKPNWVLHLNKSGASMDCMVTHTEFIVATVEMVAALRPACIALGDAPLQRCQWDKLVTPEVQQRIRRAAGGVPVEFVDFRRTVMAGATLSADVQQERRARDRYVLFDLGADSLIEPLTEDGNFRVTMYDPGELAKTHCRGRHQYLLARDVFEADVVINLPKLKTHRKSGLTAALKNLVGINGNKDYLPHHRFGGSEVGGDCYPGFYWWKHASELYLDAANRVIGTPAYDVWVSRADRLHELFSRFYDADIEGGWHGNDTCWRMNLDLNRCLIYGDADARLHDTPQRRVLNLTDAIVCGQGEGPLAPLPLPLGAVTFSEFAAASDLAHGALLRFDHRKVGLLRGCFEPMRFPVLNQRHMPKFITARGRLDYEELARTLGRAAEPPRGWKGHCELDSFARTPPLQPAFA